MAGFPRRQQPDGDQRCAVEQVEKILPRRCVVTRTPHFTLGRLKNKFFDGIEDIHRRVGQQRADHRRRDVGWLVALPAPGQRRDRQHQMSGSIHGYVDRTLAGRDPSANRPVDFRPAAHGPEDGRMRCPDPAKRVSSTSRPTNRREHFSNG